MKQVSINSTHVTNSIEAQLIHLYKVIKVEHACDHDSAREHVRRFLAKQHKECMSKEAKEMIINIKITVTNKIKCKTATEEDRIVYKLLSYLEL